MGTDLEPPPIDADRTTKGLYVWLEERLFPAIIGYTTHPLHIDPCSHCGPGYWCSSTLFELVGGNYTNGLSAMAASIVLLQQTHQRRELRHLHRNHQDVLEACTTYWPEGRARTSPIRASHKDRWNEADAIRE